MTFLEQLAAWGAQVAAWAADELLVAGTLAELGIVLLALTAGRLLASPLRTALAAVERRPGLRPLQAPAAALSRRAVPTCWLALLGLSLLVAKGAGWSPRLLTLSATLLLAWIVIGIASQTVRNATVARSIALMAWTLAALSIVGWLDHTLVVLDQIAVQLGVVRLSALSVVKAVATLAVLLWVAMLVASFVENRLRGIDDFTPSVQVLLSKLARVVLITLALVLALASVGIDLTAFAVFSGAVGVGVGFGLQKVVSNLVSGLILLLDKSIKPGDVIAVADYYGRVDSLGARYVSVITRDGIEHLIPNEELVTSRVENWSHSQNLLRIRVPVGVHYKSDVHKAIELCLEAAAETERILDEPAAVCHLRGFGDSSVDLEIRYWINDPMNGRANVTSRMLLRVWDKFHEHGIEIPYPQRDLHIRTPQSALDVHVTEPDAG